MQGYECTECGTELHYEQFPGGIRAKRRHHDGMEYYNAYCPTCKEYFETDGKPSRKDDRAQIINIFNQIES